MSNVQRQLDCHTRGDLSFNDLPRDVHAQIVQHMELPDFINFTNTTDATRTYFLGKESEGVWRHWLPSSCQKSIEGKGYEDWPPEYRDLVPSWYRDNNRPIQGLVRKIADLVTDIFGAAVEPYGRFFDLNNELGTPTPYYLGTVTNHGATGNAPPLDGFTVYTDTNGTAQYVGKREAYRFFRHIIWIHPSILVYEKMLDTALGEPGPATWVTIEALFDDGTLCLDREMVHRTAKAMYKAQGVPHSLWVRILEHVPTWIRKYKNASPHFISDFLKAHPNLLASGHVSKKYIEYLIQLFGPEKLRELSPPFHLFGSEVAPLFATVQDETMEYQYYVRALYALSQTAQEDVVRRACADPLAPDEESPLSLQRASTQRIMPSEDFLFSFVQVLITTGKTLFTRATSVRSFVLAVLAKKHIHYLNISTPEPKRHLVASAITCLETWLEEHIDTLLNENGSPFNTSDEFEGKATFEQIVGMVCDCMSDHMTFLFDSL